MTIFNIFLLILAIIAVVWGFMQGLVRQLGSVAGIILGVITARLFAPDVAAWLIKDNPQGQTVAITVLAYVGVFLLVYICAKLIAYLFHNLLRAIHLGIINSLCGAVFKLLMWVFLLSLALNLWIAVAPDSAPVGVWAERVVLFAPTIMGAESATELLQAVHV